ncbi:hypothetical protein H9P43_005677 [Blastocladiella emersonii ATCC 22665]|nr:hypothetical protein H9P43_005677 [Blastocladiella emersonii ATCC 22665]
MSLVLLIGLAAALGLSLWFRSIERKTFLRDFTNTCQVSVRSLETVFAVRSIQYLTNLASFAHATSDLSLERLGQYGTRSSFDRNLFYRMMLAAVIDKAQAGELERWYNLTIWSNPDNLAENDTIMCVGVYLWAGDGSTSRGVGWSLLTDDLRRKPILDTINSNHWTSSTPMLFLDNHKLGVSLYMNVAPRDPTPLTPFTRWVVSVGLNLHDLFTNTLLSAFRANDDLKRNAFALRMHYPGYPEPVFIYDPASTRAGANNSTLTPESLATHETYVLPFVVKGLDPWRVECIPTKAYRHQYGTVWPWVLFAIVTAVSIVAAELARRGLKRVVASQQTLRRVRAQERLLDTLRDYSKAITQAIPDGMVLLDSDGLIMGANDAALEMAGYSMGQLDRVHVSAVLSVQPINTAEPNEHFSATFDEDGVEATASSGSSLRSSVSTLRATSFRSPSTLVSGTHDGLVLRRDGSTLAIQLSVSAVEDSTERTMTTATTPPPGAAQPEIPLRRRLAQVVLFHDISERVEHMRKAAGLQRSAAESARARRRLLQLVVGSVYEDAQDMVVDLNSANAKDAARGELDDACEAAWHVVDTLNDVAGYSGVEMPCPVDRVEVGSGTLAEFVGRVIESALELRRSKINARALDVAVDLAALGSRPVPAASSTALLAIVTKAIEVAVKLAEPQAQCRIAATTSPPATATTTRRSSTNMTELLKFTVSLSRTSSSASALQQLTRDDASDPGAGLDLTLGSRGSEFGNVSLTYAALVKMVQLAGGRVEVAPQSATTGSGESGWIELTVIVLLI